MWMNLRYTFTSPTQTDSAEWCAEQTVIALGVFSISVVFGFIYIISVLSMHNLGSCMKKRPDICSVPSHTDTPYPYMHAHT